MQQELTAVMGLCFLSDIGLNLSRSSVIMNSHSYRMVFLRHRGGGGWAAVTLQEEISMMHLIRQCI